MSDKSLEVGRLLKLGVHAPGAVVVYVAVL
jgi:hypothetical protein